jgi:hypothetical protein
MTLGNFNCKNSLLLKLGSNARNLKPVIARKARKHPKHGWKMNIDFSCGSYLPISKWLTNNLKNS